MSKQLRWSKVAIGEWHGRLVDSPPTSTDVIAVAAKTGTHLDHYPWDWYLTSYGMTLVPTSLRPCSEIKCSNPKAHERRHAGVTDTLRNAKQEVESNLQPLDG